MRAGAGGRGGAAEPPAGRRAGPPGSVEAQVARPPLGKRWVRDDVGSPRAPVTHEGRVFVTAERRC